jgi:hypothetical protein
MVLAKAGGKLGIIILVGMAIAIAGYALAPPRPLLFPVPFAEITDMRAAVITEHLDGQHVWIVNLTIDRTRDPEAPCEAIDELTTVTDLDGQVRGSTRVRQSSPVPIDVPTVETRAIFDGDVMEEGRPYLVALEARCITADGIVWGPAVLTPLIEITPICVVCEPLKDG